MAAAAHLIADRIAAAAAGRSAPLVVGLTGPQGSGKTTLAGRLPELLSPRGLRAAVLALDDLYLTRADRRRLAADTHPLFATRGVPGTHDISLGLSVLQDLQSAAVTRVPVFDKATDDRAPPAQWREVQGPADVVIFEGWCVGARPQGPAALTMPDNDLERDEDADGVWRRTANGALAGPYQALFGQIGFQVLLLAPDFDVVLGWRLQQEHELRANRGGGQSDAQVARFIQHYERLTRHIAAEMPPRADLVVELDADRRPRRLGP